MKKWIAVLLVLVLTVPIYAAPEALAEGGPTTNVFLTCLDGTAGVSGNEGPDRLFDGALYTHWCTRETNSPYVIFQADRGVSVSGYVFITGDDCHSWKNRNPLTWTLYGARGSAAPGRNSSAWEIIDHRENDTVLQDVNSHGYSFLLSKSTPVYRYFMLVVEKHHGANVMQLGEMKLFVCDRPSTPNLIATPSQGTPGVSSNEGYDRLVDASVGTKWCVKAVEEPYVIWQLNNGVKVTGYQLVTGDDTASFKTRNPKSWELYGCTAINVPGRSSNQWKLLARVTNDTQLPAENYAPVTYSLDAPASRCNCFMFVVKASAGANLIQLGELILQTEENIAACMYYPDGSIGNPNPAPGPNTNPSKITCPRCNGRKVIDCSFCYGRGTTDKYVPGTATRKGYTKQETCSKCHGRKVLTCPLCNGTGVW